jgi:hypothetical protein
MHGERALAPRSASSHVIYRRSCEKLQASCDEAASNSERHQAALAKQVEANKVLDNDLKMMCACLTLTCHATRHTAVRYRKHKKDTADLEDKYKRDDYGRRYACAPASLARLYHVTRLTVGHSYAISRLDRCEGLLQEWGAYIQSAAATARSMDEVCPSMHRTASHSCLVPIRWPPSTRRARRWSRAS